MKFLLLFILLLTFSSFAETFTILDRDENFDVIVRNVELPLISNHKFESKNFRITHALSNEAITTNISDQNLKFKASTVLYHLEKAKRFFVSQLLSDYVSMAPQMIVRLEMSRPFHNKFHFGSKSLRPEYNNAISVPAGIERTIVLPNRSNVQIEAWGEEIWFRPAVDEKIPEELRNKNLAETNQALDIFREQGQTISFQNYLAELFNARDAIPISDSNARLAASLFLFTAGSHVMKNLFGLLMPSTIYLDAALIPEIIYHEYSHIAMSDHISLGNFPIVEGMADYFAAIISKSDETLIKISDHVKNIRSKDPHRGDKYKSIFESKDYSQIDFTLSVLWVLRDLENDKDLANQTIFDLRRNIDARSSIREDLLRALVNRYKQSCAVPWKCKINISHKLSELGL